MSDNEITVSDIHATYKVLEQIREDFLEDGMKSEAELINDAHYYVQEFEQGGNHVCDHPVLRPITFGVANDETYEDVLECAQCGSEIRHVYQSTVCYDDNDRSFELGWDREIL